MFYYVLCVDVIFMIVAVSGIVYICLVANILGCVLNPNFIFQLFNYLHVENNF